MSVANLLWVGFCSLVGNDADGGYHGEDVGVDNGEDEGKISSLDRKP